MKIALIAGSKIPSRTANSIQTMKMAQALVEVGHSVRVIVPGTTPEDSWDKLASHYGLSAQIDIQWVRINTKLRSYDFGIKSVRAARSWGAELIYTRLPQAAAYASVRGFSTVLEVHDMPGGKLGPMLMRKFIGGNGARRMIIITKALQEALFGKYTLPTMEGFLVVAPDGVDLERYKNLPSARKSREILSLPEEFTAGYTGHLYAGRGIELILQLAARATEIKFLIVGGEPGDVSKLKEQIKQLDLDNVSVFGFMSNAELPRYQAACDVLLMPYQHQVSASSGGDISKYLSPMKMFEYLAGGRAILSSDLPVLQEVLSHEENALVLGAEDLDGWYDALNKLKADPDYKARLAENAKETAQRYSWKARAKIILDGIEA